MTLPLVIHDIHEISNPIIDFALDGFVFFIGVRARDEIRDVFKGIIADAIEVIEPFEEIKLALVVLDFRGGRGLLLIRNHDLNTGFPGFKGIVRVEFFIAFLGGVKPFVAIATLIAFHVKLGFVLINRTVTAAG